VVKPLAVLERRCFPYLTGFWIFVPSSAQASSARALAENWPSVRLFLSFRKE